MRKFLSGVLLLPALAFSQSQLPQPTGPVEVKKPVVCDSTDRMVSYLNEEYGEVPIMFGSASPKEMNGPSKGVIMANMETETWSFIQVAGDTSCLISSGGNIILLIQNTKEKFSL